MALLSDWEEEAEATPPVIDAVITEVTNLGNEDALSGLLAELGNGSLYNWKSDDMEADFSVAVELLMESQIYLKILRDLIKRFGVLSLKQEEAFKLHMECIEEFTGQWLNDEDT
jgi:hypothetical protein